MFLNMKILLLAALSLYSYSGYCQDAYKGRPLIIAITEKGDLNKVKAALDKGANVNETTDVFNGSISALQFAKYNIYKKDNHPGEKFEVLKLLLEKGADTNHFDARGRSAFNEVMKDSQHAEDNFSEDQKSELLTLILKNGLDLKRRHPTSGDTPLHYLVLNAIQWNTYSKSIDMLLDAGADPNLKNNEGESALSIVEKKANEEVKKPFLAKIKLLNSKNKTKKAKAQK